MSWVKIGLVDTVTALALVVSTTVNPSSLLAVSWNSQRISLGPGPGVTRMATGAFGTSKLVGPWAGFDPVAVGSDMVVKLVSVE